MVEDLPPMDTAAALKLALRGMAASVAVISMADADGQCYAMAATAVSALSMEPPSMLVCVNRSNFSHGILAAGAHFAINILSADQMEVAQLCGGRAQGEARFAAGDWVREPGQTPYLRDAQTSLLCTQSTRFAYGSHDIFVGDVQRVLHEGGSDPLLYVDGAYRRIGNPV